MASILTTIDVEDVGTPKIREFRDALSDLLTVQQQTVSGAAAMSTGLQGSVAALGSVNQATRQAATGYQQLADAQEQTIQSGAGLHSALVELSQAVAQAAVRQSEATQQIQLYATSLATLATAAREGVVPLQLQAEAAQELADAARAGQPGLAEHAKFLQEIADQTRQGIPLTEAQTDALAELTQAYAEGNREALGMVSATQQLVEEHRQATVATQEISQAWGVLTVQLREGATVSQLQKDAMSELADAAQGLATISEQDKVALAALNEEIRVGATITPEQAAAIQRLNSAMEESVGVTREQASAIQELIRAEREQMALTREQAEAAEILERQLQEGAVVTEQQKRAMDELNSAMKENPRFTDKTRQAMEHLTYGLDIGHKVTEKHRLALMASAQGAREAAQGANEASKSVDGFSANMAIATAGLTALTAGLYSYLRGSTELAARNEVLGTVIGIVSKNINASNIETQVQIERVKALGITTAASTQAILDFAQAELKVSDAAKIARAAQDLAVIANMNSSEAFSRLTAAIQLQQPRLLRQFGIMTNLNAVYDKYAVTVGKTVKELTTFDRRQAFVNLILAEAGKASGAYEASMNDVGKQAGSMARLIEEVRVELGERLLPIMRLVVGTSSDLLKWFLNLSDGAKTFAAAVLSAAAAMTTFGAVFTGARFLGGLKLLKSLTETSGWALLTTQVGKLGTVLNTLGGLVTRAGGGLQGLWRGFAIGAVASTAHMKTLGGVVSKVFELLTSSGGRLTALFSGLLPVIRVVWTAIAAHPVGYLATAIGLATAAFIGLSNSGKRAADAIREDFAKAQGSIDGIREQVKAVEELTTRISVSPLRNAKAGSVGAEQYGRMVEELSQKLGKLQAIIPGVEMKQDSLTKMWRVSAKQVDDATKEYEDLQKVLRDEVIAALADAEVAVAENSATIQTYSTRLRIATEANGDLGEALRLATEALAQNENAILGNTSVWSDLWTVIKNTGILALHALTEMLKAVWTWLLRIADDIRDVVVGRLEALTEALRGVIPDSLLKILESIPGLIKRITVDEIHKGAQASQALVDSLDPKKVENTRNEFIKLGQSLRIPRDELQRLFEEMEGTAGTRLQKAMSDARNEIVGAGDEAKKVAEIQKAGLMDLWQQLKTGVKEVTNAAGVKVKVDLDPEEVSRIKNTIIEKLQDMTEAGRKEAERLKKAYQSAFEGFMGTDPELQTKLKALNEALRQTTGDQEAYNAVLERGRGVIGAYNKLTDDQKKGLDHIGAAAKRLEEIDLQRWFQSWADEAQKGIAATNIALNELTGELQQQFRADQLSTTRDLENERQELNDRIYEMDRELFEQLTVSKMREVDQHIYQEHRRLDDLRHSMDEEQRLREQAMKAAEDELKLRMNGERKAFLQKTQQIRMSMNLRTAEAEHEMRLQLELGKMDQREFDARMGRMQEARDLLNNNLLRLEQQGLQEITREEQKQRDLLAIKRRAMEEGNALMEDAFARQVEGSRRAIAEIQDQYNELLQFAKGIFFLLAESFSENLVRTLSGAQSWADGLKNIWNSLKNAFFSFVDSLIKKWLTSGIAQMFGMNAGGQTGFGGLVQGLFGQGALSNVLGAGQQAAGGMVFVPGVGMLPKSMAPGGAAATGTPWWATGFGSGALAAGAGGLVGFGVGSQFDSRTAGGLAGAGSGFATGALMGSILPGIGTLIGGVIGGIAGLIGGILGGGREARAVAKAREEYIRAKGGIEELRKEAERTGVSIDKMMDTKKVKEFQHEVGVLENAIAVHKMIDTLEAANGGFEELQRRAERAGVSLDGVYKKAGISAEELAAEIERINKALELQDAKDNLARTFSQMMDLSRAAQLVGFDLQKLYDSTTIEEFNGHQAHLNKLLEEQRMRIEGLKTAAQGLGQRLAGELATLEKAFGKILPDEGDLKDFFDAFERARRRTRDLSLTDFARRPDVRDEFDLDSKDIERIGKVAKDAQAAFNRLGMVAAAIFAQMVRQTGDWVAAMEVVGPHLDTLIEMQKRLGLRADDTIRRLLGFRRIIRANEDVVNSLSGITQILRGLADAGGLTQEVFQAMGRDAAEQFEILRERGVSVNNSLLLMQPTLQAIYEAQKRFGYTVDENTQKLLNMAKKNGLVGDQFMPVQERMLEILLLIAEALGAVIPEGYRKWQDAATRAGDAAKDGAQDAIDGQKRLQVWLERMRKEWTYSKDVALDALNAMEREATFAAEGRSPTGVQQIVVRLHEVIDTMRQLRQVATAEFGRVERSAGGLRLGPMVAPAARSIGTVVVQNRVEMPVQVNALDNANMEEAWREKIQPQMERSLENNSKQIAFKVQRASNRYRQRVS